MRSLDEHRCAVLALVDPLPAATVPVGSALGLVLAQDVVARVDLPGFDNSAMDGYAVRAAELAGATAETPVVLPVAGDVAAGDTTHHVLPAGHVLRIMTGAPMPEGADAVVPVELTDGGATRWRSTWPRRPAARCATAARTSEPATRCCRPGPASARATLPSRRRRTSPSCRSGPARGWSSSPPATSWSSPARRSSTVRSSTPTP